MEYIKLGSGQGYIALISVILLSAVVSVLAVSQGLLVWNSHSQVQNSWAKKQSLLLAEGCIRVAATQLRGGVIPPANLTVSIQDDRCRLVEVIPESTGWQARASASVLGAESNLLAQIDGTSFAVTVESEPP